MNPLSFVGSTRAKFAAPDREFCKDNARPLPACQAAVAACAFRPRPLEGRQPAAENAGRAWPAALRAGIPLTPGWEDFAQSGRILPRSCQESGPVPRGPASLVTQLLHLHRLPCGSL
jgi:hypothetical protein